MTGVDEDFLRVVLHKASVGVEARETAEPGGLVDDARKEPGMGRPGGKVSVFEAAGAFSGTRFGGIGP
jgi:hypothetical protein